MTRICPKYLFFTVVAEHRIRLFVSTFFLSFSGSEVEVDGAPHGTNSQSGFVRPMRRRSIPEFKLFAPFVNFKAILGCQDWGTFPISTSLTPVWLPRKPRNLIEESERDKVQHYWKFLFFIAYLVSKLDFGVARIWSRFCLVLLWYYHNDEWSTGRALPFVHIRLEFVWFLVKWRKVKDFTTLNFVFNFFIFWYLNLGPFEMNKSKALHNFEFSIILS